MVESTDSLELISPVNTSDPEGRSTDSLDLISLVDTSDPEENKQLLYCDNEVRSWELRQMLTFQLFIQTFYDISTLSEISYDSYKRQASQVIRENEMPPSS